MKNSRTARRSENTFVAPRRTRLLPAPLGLAGVAVVLSALGAGAPAAHGQSGPAGRGAAPRVASRARSITLSFAGADAADVLRAISVQSGINIAITPGAAARGRSVSVRLRNVSVDEAVRLVTQTAGFGFRRVGSTYLVGLPEEIKQAGVAAGNFLTTYALRNLTPAAAKTLIEGVLPQVTVQTAEGAGALVLSGPEPDVIRAQRLLSASDVPVAPVSLTITPTNVAASALADVLRRAAPGLSLDVQGGTVILTGPQEAINRAREIVTTVDTPAGAGRRLEIYNVKYSSASSLATMLIAALPGLQATPSAEPLPPPPARLQTIGIGGGLSSSTGGASGSGGQGGGGQGAQGSQGAQLTTSTVGLDITNTNVSNFRSRSLIIVGREADVEAALRLLQAVDVAPAQVEIEARIVNLSLDNTLDLGIEWAGNTGAYQSNITVGEQDIRDVVRFGRFARTNLQSFSATLHYLETRGRSKTLANPHISVIDNEEASVFIGEVRRFAVQALASTATDQTFIVQVQEVPVGIALLVRPRVNSETGEITMNIKPAVSTITSLVQGIPQTATREASTTLRARDGETIVIGGLISDQETKSLQQVPILGDIPIIGELFRRRINTRTRSEILLFLTPRLLRGNGAAEAAAVQERLPENLKAKSLIPGSRPKP